MSEGFWKRNGLTDKVLKTLKAQHRAEEHHLRHDFMTPYQIALALDEQLKQEGHAGVETLFGLKIGGKGTGENQSVAQQIGWHLSRLCRNKQPNLEGGFLSDEYLNHLEFDRGIVSSRTGSGEGVSLFRWVD